MCSKGNDDYSVEILADLIKQGYSGEELLNKFIEAKGKTHTAVERMIDEAKTTSSKCSLDELFASEDNSDLSPKFMGNCHLAMEEMKRGKTTEFKFRKI